MTFEHKLKGSERLNYVEESSKRREESKGLISGSMSGVGGTARKPAELEWCKPGENAKK